MPRNGYFSQSTSYGGYTATVAVTLNGYFPKAHLAGGAFRARPIVYDADGHVGDRYDSGRISWWAKRR